MTLQQEFRIILDLDFHTDPAINVIVTGDNLDQLINKAKGYASDLVAFTGARGVRSVDLVNGHTILGFIKIPI